MKKLILLTFLFTILLIPYANAQPNYTIRTVYFQPTDAPPPTTQIIPLLVESQNFFQSEMERHGYGAKTFKLETNETGNLGFHHIRAKHNTTHYSNDTYNRARSELPRYLTSPAYARDNILIIIVAGLNNLNTGDKGYGGYYLGDNTGGFVIIVNKALNFKNLTHEIGHTFGLNHPTDPKAIMFTGSKYILDYEARWLDRHPFFNDTHIRNGTPQIIKILPITAIGDHKLQFKIVLKSQNGLYQAQVTRNKSQDRLSIVIGTAEIEGLSTTIKIIVNKETLKNGDNVDIQIMDIHGNKAHKTLNNITLPKPLITDINADKIVNIQDLVLVASRFGKKWNGKEDVNNDGVINILDLVLVANDF